MCFAIGSVEWMNGCANNVNFRYWWVLLGAAMLTLTSGGSE